MGRLHPCVVQGVRGGRLLVNVLLVAAAGSARLVGRQGVDELGDHHQVPPQHLLRDPSTSGMSDDCRPSP